MSSQPKTEWLQMEAMLPTGVGKVCPRCGRVARVFFAPAIKDRCFVEWSKDDVSSVNLEDLLDDNHGCGSSCRIAIGNDLDLVTSLTAEEAATAHHAIDRIRSPSHQRMKLAHQEMKSARDAGDVVRFMELDAEFWRLVKEQTGP